MKILMLDHSVAFDPDDRETKPLGARQRGFIALAEALASAGHQVEARRNGSMDHNVHGVAWFQTHSQVPAFSGEGPDLGIVWSNPQMLDHILLSNCHKRLFWSDQTAAFLQQDAIRRAVLESKARINYVDARQLKRDHGDWAISPVSIAPAGCPNFGLAAKHYSKFEVRDCRAVSVANSKSGVESIISIWRNHVAPKVDGACLDIYAYDLFSALAGEGNDVSEHLIDLVRDSMDDGVRVLLPRCEVDMARKIARARCFLHFGKAGYDRVGQWLLDAQAAGTPVVSFGGIAEIRVENGQSGYIVPDDAAYGNLVAQLLQNASIFQPLSDYGQRNSRQWHDVVADLEAL